jgi:hypothetical protein
MYVGYIRWRISLCAGYNGRTYAYTNGTGYVYEWNQWGWHPWRTYTDTSFNARGREQDTDSGKGTT